MPRNIRVAVWSAFCLGSLVSLAGCLSSSDSQEADPVVVENAVAYVQRPLLFDEDTGQLVEDNVADPSAFRPGARLFLRDSASADGEAVDITSSAFSDPEFLDENGELRYDVKDLHVSHDGTRLLFAMRAPEIEDADEEDQPTWNIWEYDTLAGELRRVIESDRTAREGQDVAPAYLPDGRIVFSSTRQTTSKSVLLDEGKGLFVAMDEERETPAFVLHVMDADGSNIQQITFNQSHDLDPVVVDDGTIVFSRWDNAGQTRDNGVNLYRVNPDGTGLEYLYGRNSHDSVSDTLDIQYFQPRQTDSDKLLVQLRPFETSDYASVFAEIDVEEYVEAEMRIDGSAGSAQSSLVDGVGLDGELSLQGSYGSVSPLLDGTGRYLVSWTPCRLREVGSDEIVNCTEERLASDEYLPAEPVYGVWLLDVAEGTQRPVVSPIEGQQFDEAVLLKERPLEAYIANAQYTGEEENLADASFGILNIGSVYDVDGVDTAPGGIAATADPLQTAPADRPKRFLRLEKPVSMPDEDVLDFDNTAFGRSRAQLMREILGYVPIEPDGSVKVAVPANVAFAVSVLDADGKRVGPRHQNWLTVRPGETLECKGCHNAGSGVPHGRKDAGPAPVWEGAATSGIPFPNTLDSLYADMGETMAEVYARINGVRMPSPDLVYEDEWTDPASGATPGESYSLAYGDLQTQAPITQVCAEDWASNCRIIINYETHIHPLWGLERPVLDADGVTVIDDYTCTSCHSTTDADGATRVPDGQLDLGDGPSQDEPLHFKSYRELLFPDNEQEVRDGALVDRLVDSGEILRNEEGEPILDADGNEQPIMVTVPVTASMSVAGAANSRFMGLFQAGGTHEGFMTPAELRLVAEWLDIGAQYFNNPFDAPED